MKTTLHTSFKKVGVLAIALGLSVSNLLAQGPKLNHVTSVLVGDVADPEGAAEIVAYDDVDQVIWVLNSPAQTIDKFDFSDVTNPTLLGAFDFSTYGNGVNSIAIYDGLVAIAVEAENKEDNGSVVFIKSSDNSFVGEAEVGALPDMLTFTHDGMKVIVANEGEPTADYSIDPVGSVSIVDISAGAGSPSVTTAGFEYWNDKAESLKNRGIKMGPMTDFNGNPLTVAQQLEPEYITVSEDDMTAYVTLQENNAIAVVDITSGEIEDVLALGVKDHMSGTPMLEEYVVSDAAGYIELGTPHYTSTPVVLGGYSGMWFAEDESDATNQVYYVIPDRGPNEGTVAKADAGTSQNLRPFMLPDYQARIVKFSVNVNTGVVSFDENDQIFLSRKDESDQVHPISGRGNIEGVDEVPVTETDATAGYPNVDYTVNGRNFHELPYDPYGGDFEGILKDKNGNFWMCDEYRPAIYQFDATGMMLHRFVAQGTAAAVGDDAGTYGEETLPAVYAKRWANRGFEAVAYDEANNVIYAFIQSPLYNPSSATKNNSDVIRILGIDATTGMPVHEYVYILERNKDAGHGPRVDKIGDAVYIGNGKFLVIERDSSIPTADKIGKKFVFEIDLLGATDLLASTEGIALSSLMDTTGLGGAVTLEGMSADDMAMIDLKPVYKRKVLNLPSVGYWPSDKPEGISLLPDGSIAVMTDNDFGLGGAGITDNSVLGIISFDDNYGYDASNKDNAINIQAHDTWGMYMPDAITGYAYNDINYLITANEGDARDYWFEVADEAECTSLGGLDWDEDDGCLAYSEETRAADLNFDSNYDSETAALDEVDGFGRVKTTIELGDIDMDGDVDQVFTYGSRSFSIWDELGNLVYDSGDDFETITASVDPDGFNGDDGSYDEFDERSDDKGPEPEGVVVGEIDGRIYAFIGLERVGGVMMYDVTNPMEVEFVDYINTTDWVNEAGDVSPEGLAFIHADDSPTGDAFLLVSYEVSGTMAIFEVGDGVITATFDAESIAQGVAYPNPTEGIVNLGDVSNVSVENVSGVEVLSAAGVSQIDLSGFAAGVYAVKFDNGSVVLVTKL